MCAMVFGVLGAVVSMAGSMMAAQSQAAAANAQAAASIANANLQRRQAMAEMTAGQREAAKKQDQVSALVSKQRTAYATAGVLIDGGSVLDVGIDTTREGMLDVGTIEWNAKVKSGNYNYQASISEMNAQNQINAGEMAMQQGMVGALSSAVKLGGQMTTGNFGFGGTSLGGSFS